jgi:hypothetical protein
LSSRIENFKQRNSRTPTAQEVYLLWHRPARVAAPTAIERQRAIRFANLVAHAIAVADGKSVQPENSKRLLTANNVPVANPRERKQP